VGGPAVRLTPGHPPCSHHHHQEGAGTPGQGLRLQGGLQGGGCSPHAPPPTMHKLAWVLLPLGHPVAEVVEVVTQVPLNTSSRGWCH
jgi:hypothetical protein